MSAIDVKLLLLIYTVHVTKMVIFSFEKLSLLLLLLLLLLSSSSSSSSSSLLLSSLSLLLLFCYTLNRVSRSSGNLHQLII